MSSTKFNELINTWEWKACPNNSPSFLAYICDVPVSVANNTVAFILRDRALPKSFDVNFTALKLFQLRFMTLIDEQLQRELI